ncbi:MAG: hypothetical protein LUF04_14605 [Bacteroides sp.]|nr:hypothetical protein [Bacteroides sp.]
MANLHETKLPSQVEHERQFLIRAGEVVEGLHIHSGLEYAGVEVQTGINERSIRRIRKAQTTPSIVCYNTLLENYFL